MKKTTVEEALRNNIKTKETYFKRLGRFFNFSDLLEEVLDELLKIRIRKDEFVVVEIHKFRIRREKSD